MRLKICQKNILYMLIIAAGGFVLFIIAFLMAFLVSQAYHLVMISFADKFSNSFSNYFSWHYLNLIIVLLFSWLVFTTRLNDLIKATFSTMPLIVILTEVGIQFYRWPVLVWVIGAIIVSAVLFYLYKTKRSWLYYFAAMFVAAVEFFVMLSGMEI